METDGHCLSTLKNKEKYESKIIDIDVLLFVFHWLCRLGKRPENR